MRLVVTFAMTQAGGIGRQGLIPWYLPEDLKEFARLTTAAENGKRNALIMGRVTWESLPKRPLPRRWNVVVSRTMPKGPVDELGTGAACVAPSLQDAFDLCCERGSIDTAFVIGGVDLIHEALAHPNCKVAYVSVLDPDMEIECDRHVDVAVLKRLGYEVYEEVKHTGFTVRKYVRERI